jgi:hypothetical protein
LAYNRDLHKRNREEYVKTSISIFFLLYKIIEFSALSTCWSDACSMFLLWVMVRVIHYLLSFSVGVRTQAAYWSKTGGCSRPLKADPGCGILLIILGPAGFPNRAACSTKAAKGVLRDTPLVRQSAL